MPLSRHLDSVTGIAVRQVYSYPKKASSSKHPAHIQMTKCAVSFGELISFLSMVEEYSDQRVLARCQSNDAAGRICESHYRGDLFLYSPISTRSSGVCERVGCSTRNSRNPTFRMAAATSFGSYRLKLSHARVTSRKLAGERKPTISRPPGFNTLVISRSPRERSGQ